jgi:hypothetical protein
MIKFFRKIPQNLLMENKTGKYFKYAIGEIILVVIGILIALQINNWNENNKKNKLNTSYITSLIDDYTKDTIQLNSSINFNKLALQETDSIMASLSSEDIELDDFVYYFKTFNRLIRTDNTFNTNSFNVLISTGNIDLFDKSIIQSLMELNRLQNDQTRVSISNSNTYIELMSNSALEYPIFSENNQFPKKTNQFLWAKIDKEKIPTVLTNIVGFKLYVVSRYLELAEETKIKTEEVLTLLNSQLKNDNIF